MAAESDASQEKREGEVARRRGLARRTMSFLSGTPRRAGATASVAGIGLCVTLLLAPLVGVGLHLAARGAAANLEQEEALVRIHLGLALARVTQEQRGLVLSDAAHARTEARDAGWMTANFGVEARARFGHDRSYVLDPGNRLIHATVHGEEADVAEGGLSLGALMPLVERLRQTLRAGALRSEAVERDLLLLGEVPAVASLRPILPLDGAAAVPRGGEYLHVAVRYIDAAFLEALREDLGFAALSLAERAPAADSGHVLLSTASGEPVAAIGWVRSRAPLGMGMDALPGLLVVVILGGGFVSYVCLLLLAAARQLRSEEARTQAMTLIDPLTELPNRRAFHAHLAGLLDKPAGTEEILVRPIVVICLDLDEFKTINDAFGPTTGDHVVRAIGQRIRELATECDCVARLGGDEFGLIWRSFGGHSAIEGLARRIMNGLRVASPLDGSEIAVTCTAGVALAWELGPDRASEAMRRAEIALHHAKEGGRSRLAIFEESFDAAVQEKRAIESDLRDALERDVGLWLALQPIYDIEGRTIVGAEALARWDHPRLGALSPARFVPVAEDCDLMHVLGLWVLRRACAAALELGLPWIAVNVSAAQFRRGDFVDVVFDTLRETGFSPDRLQIEITEGLILDETPAVASAILQLRFAGVKIAIDDFGTGYSSLGYLTRYTVDKIKIDRSFIRRLGEDEQAAHVVKALTDLASALHLEVTVEGVETHEQWQALRRLGHPELQGFLFARPMPPAELAPLLAAPRARRAARGGTDGRGSGRSSA